MDLSVITLKSHLINFLSLMKFLDLVSIYLAEILTWNVWLVYLRNRLLGFLETRSDMIYISMLHDNSADPAILIDEMAA